MLGWQSITQALLAVPYCLKHPLIASNTFNHSAVQSTTILPAHIVSNATWQYIDEVRDRWDIPGLSVAVVARASDGPRGVHDRTDKRWPSLPWRQEVRGFGVANAAGDAVTRDTLFSIASNSKLFTALAISQLVEDGTAVTTSSNSTAQLSWQTRVRDILPGWRTRDAVTAERATLQDVAGMVLGFPDHTIAIRAEDPSYIPGMLGALSPSRDFRAEMYYNNMAYALLHHIVDLLSPQRDLIQFMQERILDKLGMRDTLYNHTAASATGRRADNFVQWGQNPIACANASWVAGRGPPLSCKGEARSTGWFLVDGDEGLHLAGWAGLVTSAGDLTKWLRELLDPQVLSRACINDARIPRSIYDGLPTRFAELGPELYGQGQIVSSYRGHQVAYHFGSISGHQSIVLRLPAQDLGVAVLTNGGYDNHAIAETVTRRVVDDVLGLEAVPWEARLARKWRKYEAGLTWSAPPEHPAPPHQTAESVAGRYESPGYGVLEITPFDPKSRAHAIWTKDLPRTIRPPGPNTTFIGRLYDSLLLPTVVLTHFDGNLFNYTAPVHAPSQRNHSIAQLAPWPSPPGQAVFDSGRLGLGSNFVQLFPTYKYNGADLTGREGDETGVDVWFVKVA